jgi:hypothetical protein
MLRIVPLILLTALALTSCASTPAPTPPAATPTPTPTVERTEVDWSTLPPEYQRLVDEDTAAGNCDGLQDTFDAAREDVALLNYLDEALELAGCYD